MTGAEAVGRLISLRQGTYFAVTGGDNRQCTAVPHSLQRDILGLPIVYGNAVDMYGNASLAHYDKLPPHVSYLPGDIVVWGQNAAIRTTSVGHVAVIVRDLGNGNFESLDQNWPTGAITQRVIHSRTGVIGILRPKVLQSGGGNQMPENYAGAGIMDWNREGIRSRVYAITGNWHTDDDLRKYHQGKTIPQVENEFFPSEERRLSIRKAGTAAWKRAFGEPYPEDKVNAHMATRLYYDQIIQQIEDDVVETMKKRNSGLQESNSMLDKIAAFVLSLKR